MRLKRKEIVPFSHGYLKAKTTDTYHIELNDNWLEVWSNDKFNSEQFSVLNFKNDKIDCMHICCALENILQSFSSETGYFLITNNK